MAAAAGIEIEFIRKRNVRKEDPVKEALAKRGEHPGLVCILSAMEPCSSYKPWHDKATAKTSLRPDDGKHWLASGLPFEYGIGGVLALIHAPVIWHAEV